jgi:hypothetical protein
MRASCPVPSAKWCLLLPLVVLCAITVWVVIAVIHSDSSTSPTGNLPLITPPIQAAAPSGLGDSNHTNTALKRRHLLSFTSTDVRDRFFRAAGGPTNMWDLLAEVDSRIAEMNMRVKQFPCLGGGTLVPYNLTLWHGRNETLHAQCSDRYNDPNGTAIPDAFGLFSLHNHTFELFMGFGETMLAARVTLQSNNLTSENVTRVELWYSVGLSNVNGSHAVVQIVAQPQERVFEMTAAGVGIGFCGVHLYASNNTLLVHGSGDTPACQCGEVTTVCCDGADIATTVPCGAWPDFQLPPLGRSVVDASLCVFNQSLYPAEGPYVQLSTLIRDEAYFGPRTPPL